MKRVLSLFALAVLASGASAADRYRVTDTGGFGSTGRHVEMASRFGWASYKAEFDFGLELGKRGVTRDSTLKLTIVRHDGSKWSTKCKAKHQDRMWANVNMLFGKGISVLAECRVDPSAFADLVDLDAGLVGEPTLVFQALVNNGVASAGVHKGMYFFSAAEIAAGELASFATSESDPSALGVIFNSAMAPYVDHPTYAMAPRLVP